MYSANRLLRVAALALLIAGASGCAIEYSARTLGVPVTMSPAPAASDSFRVTLRAVHVFWGLAPIREPSLQHALANQLGPAGGVANLTIRSRKRWSDLLVTALTAGFVQTTAVTFQGVVVRGAP